MALVLFFLFLQMFWQLYFIIFIDYTYVDFCIICFRLKQALAEVYPLLTDEEKRRNKRGDSRMYVCSKHPSYVQLCDMYRLGMDEYTEVIFFFFFFFKKRKILSVFTVVVYSCKYFLIK